MVNDIRQLAVPLASLTAITVLGTAAVIYNLNSDSGSDAVPPAASSSPTSNVVIDTPDVPEGNTAVDPDTGLTPAPGSETSVAPYVTDDGDVIAGASEALIKELEKEHSNPLDSIDPRALEVAGEYTEIYFGQMSSDQTPQRWLDRLSPTISSGYEQRLRDSATESGELAYADPQGRPWRFRVDVQEVLVSEWFPTDKTDLTFAVSFVAQLLVDEQSNGKATSRTMFVHVEKVEGLWRVTGLKETGDHEPWD